MYHAQPRFAASLASGENVSFAHEGQPYIARTSQQASSCSACLLVVNASDQGAANFEVVREDSDGVLGFRCTGGHARGRFLQVSRRRGHRLLLFNTRFGTNEQWHLTQCPRQPWTHAQLQLRHKRFAVRYSQLCL